MTQIAQQAGPSTERRWSWADAGVAAGLLALTLAALGRALVTPGTLVYHAHSDIDYYYTLEFLVRHSFASGAWPLWNPYWGAGALGLANPQAAILYPPLMLLRLLPLDSAFNLGAALHIWLAGLGMFALLRDMDVSRPGAATAAVGFMFSGVVMPRLVAGHVPFIYATAWPGWIMLFYRRLLFHRSLLSGVLAAFTSAFVILSGHLQFSSIVLAAPASLFLVYLVAAIRRRDWAALGWGIAASLAVAILALGLCAAQLAPTLMALPYTRRGVGLTYNAAMEYSFHPWLLLTMADPFLLYSVPTQSSLGFGFMHELSPYAGLIPLLLAGLAFFSDRAEVRRLARVLIAFALLSLILAMGRWTPAGLLSYRVVPLFRVPGRYLFGWAFVVALLSGFGLDALLGFMQAGRARIWQILKGAGIALSALAALAGIALAIWWQRGEALTQAIQASGRFYWLDARTFAQAELYNTALFLIVIASLAAVAWLGASRVISPARWAWSVAAAAALEMTLFAASLVVPNPVSTLRDLDHPAARLDIDPAQVRVADDTITLSTLLVPISHEGDEVMGLRWMHDIRRGARDDGQKILSAAYVISAAPLDDPALRLVQQGADAYLYVQRDNWPRLYAAPAIQVVDRDEDALSLIVGAGFDPFASAVVLTGQDAPPLPPLGDVPQHAAFSARMARYEANTLQALVDVDRPVMVVFGESYFPGWRGWVDGQPVPVWRVNYAFRGLVVPPGQHVLEMRFEPPGLRLGIAVSLGSLVVLALIAGSAALAGRGKAPRGPGDAPLG